MHIINYICHVKVLEIQFDVLHFHELQKLPIIKLLLSSKIRKTWHSLLSRQSTWSNKHSRYKVTRCSAGALVPGTGLGGFPFVRKGQGVCTSMHVCFYAGLFSTCTCRSQDRVCCHGSPTFIHWTCGNCMNIALLEELVYNRDSQSGTTWFFFSFHF